MCPRGPFLSTEFTGSSEPAEWELHKNTTWLPDAAFYYANLCDPIHFVFSAFIHEALFLAVEAFNQPPLTEDTFWGPSC